MLPARKNTAAFSRHCRVFAFMGITQALLVFFLPFLPIGGFAGVFIGHQVHDLLRQHDPEAIPAVLSRKAGQRLDAIDAVFQGVVVEIHGLGSVGDGAVVFSVD